MAGSRNTTGRDRAAILDQFGKLAAGYGAGEYYARRRAAVIAAVHREVARSRRILDLGCGNGRYLLEFRNLVPRAFAMGVDLSPEMLAEALDRNGMATPFVLADVSALPFKDASFDLIFASHVLQFIADVDAIAHAIVKLLKSGGVLAITVGAGGIRAALRGLLGTDEWPRFEEAIFRRRSRQRPDETHYGEAFSRAGLSCDLRPVRFTVGWTGVEEWLRLRWMSIQSEQQRQAANRVLEEASAKCRDQTFPLEERLLICHKF